MIKLKLIIRKAYVTLVAHLEEYGAAAAEALRS